MRQALKAMGFEMQEHLNLESTMARDVLKEDKVKTSTAENSFRDATATLVAQQPAKLLKPADLKKIAASYKLDPTKIISLYQTLNYSFEKKSGQISGVSNKLQGYSRQ
jgi:hypothetical protein